MEPPDDNFREHIYSQLSEFEAAEDQAWVEGQLAQVLEEISQKAREASSPWSGSPDHGDLDEETAVMVLASVESWVSILSYALGRAYAPSSPWPKRLKRNLAGWGARITKLIQQVVGWLLKPLSASAHVLGAINYAIGLNYPWGVSVQLTWT